MVNENLKRGYRERVLSRVCVAGGRDGYRLRYARCHWLGRLNLWRRVRDWMGSLVKGGRLRNLNQHLERRPNPFARGKTERLKNNKRGNPNLAPKVEQS